MVLLFLAAGCEPETRAPAASESAITESHRAIVTRGTTEVARFRVDIVDDDAGRSAGLSAFAPLNDAQGLVLAWSSSTRVCIWNRPVGYPIDVAYVDDAGRILALEHFEAADARSRCHDSVLFVLETRAEALAEAAIGDAITLVLPDDAG